MADSLPISGHIDPKSFPYLLVDLHRQGATGSLKVDGANHQKALYFRAGRVLFASSNDPRDQLGAILVESGKITEAQLEDVNQKVGQGNPLAKALSDSGVVTQRELSDAARAKVERILSDVISYAEGSFEFEDGVLPKGAVDLKLAPERLFIAAVRRVADRAFVLRHLDGLNVVLSPKPELREKLAEIESEVGGLPDHLNGMATLKDVASLTAIDEFDAAKIACGLLFLGLIEKGAGAESEEASPFFMPAEAGGELDLSGGGSPQFGDFGGDASPSISFDAPQPVPEPETVEPAELLSPPQVAPLGTDETLMLGDLPSFSFGDLNSPAAPEPVQEAAPPPAPTPVGGGTGPLKIIQPPKAAERTRPPQRPSKDDLAALDELLGKKSPEGPLTPLTKPAAEWQPQFLPAKDASRNKKKSASAGAGRNWLAIGGGAIVIALVLGGGYYYWTTMAASPVKVAAQPSPVATTLPPTTLVATAATTEPSPTGSAAATAATTLPPTTLAAKPSAPPVTTVADKPTPAPVTSIPAKPTPAPPKPGLPTAGNLGQARALLRKGQFPEAANAFMASLKAGKDPYALQLLVACSAETLEKVNVATAADDLFIVPVHYKGKDCYRIGWGVYDSEAKANAGARSVPAYFREGGARPKVVTITEITK